MLDFKQTEEQILKFWKEKKIYEKSKKKNAKGKNFYFLQGPPYTSGRLHIGHAWNNSLKDIALRYFRLKGYNVWDRAGYDMHGLPTENAVQKEMKLSDKKAILNYGLEKFIRKCKEFSLKNVKLMNEDLKRLGIWMDFDNAYLPIENDFMSAEWLLIKEAWKQKRLYRGEKIMQWCAKCETSLAKHELEYESVKENSIFLKFKIKNNSNEYLVVWTTTPWTIPFNLAVMVNPRLDYVKVEVDLDEKGKNKEIWIVAKALANVFVSELLGKKFRILQEFKGKELEGIEYEHPFFKELEGQFLSLDAPIHKVILSEKYVDTTSGSGLVHCAPGCGPEDYEVGREYKIPPFNCLDEKGIFQDMGKLSGLVAKKDDKKFVDLLKEKGVLITETDVEHEYPYCWRCHNPVVFRTTSQWFLKIEDLIPKILDYNKKIKWVPDSAKNSYESWISNLRDNGVTRQRFWGTPAPIWECENQNCGNVEVIGSEEELKRKAIGKLPQDLHKPWIDSVNLKCDKCGKEMKRIPDVIDVWIDSGTVSWNCLYYPKENKYFEKFFPADFILEATEQTHLWFSMLQLCSTIMFNKSSFKGVYSHGMILDYNGMKMSKSLGNIISPYEVIDKYSSEILRYYMCESKAGENLNFNWEDVKQKQRNLLVFWNLHKLLVDLKNNKKPGKAGLEEKYMISRLNSSIKKITELFDNYHLDKTITEIQKLFLDLSRIYVQLTREKSDEKAVYSVVLEVYIACLKMFSTVCPLITEAIWQELRKEKIVKEESVHLCSWPKADDKKIDKKLEESFSFILEIIEKGLAERDNLKIGLKWPLAKATITCNRAIPKELQEIIERQLNVKKIEIKKSKNKELEVELDTKMTPELEAEGFAREIARKVQALRKKGGFVKQDKIELLIVTGLNLKNHEKFIQERTNSKKIEIAEKESGKYKHISKEIIKDKEIKILFNKI